jgi:hypothetical protein
MGLQKKYLRLEDMFAKLAESTINLIAETVVSPMTCDCRKLAEFSLPKEICECVLVVNNQEICIGDEIVTFIESQGLKVEVKESLLSLTLTSGVRDERREFFVFKQQETFDEFINSLIQFGKSEINRQECARRIGKLFGYSDESINNYLANPDQVWPHEENKEFFANIFPPNSEHQKNHS